MLQFYPDLQRIRIVAKQDGTIELRDGVLNGASREQGPIPVKLWIAKGARPNSELRSSSRTRAPPISQFTKNEFTHILC